MGKIAVVYIITWLSVIAGYGWYAVQPDVFTALRIEASSDQADLGHPVFAQFVYTQSLVLPQPVAIRRLEIPMHIEREAPTVRIYKEGVLVKEWRQDTAYEFDDPQTLSGNIEVQIDGRHIPHGQKDEAPHIFIETADYAYPDGNYRVADNQKEGDIGMVIYGQRTQFHSFLKEWKEKPGAVLHRSLTYIGLVFLLTLAPFVVVGHRGARRNRGQKPKTAS